MSNTEIENYIKDSLQKGYTTEKIRESLLSAGWEVSYVNSCIKRVLDNQTDFYELVPPSPNSNTRDDYRHFSHPLNSIGYLIGLISFFVSFFAIYYFFVTAIGFYFPDYSYTLTRSVNVTSYLDGVFFVITSALAAGVVATPLYITVLFLTRKYESVYPLIRRSYTRKFHVFAILIVTFISIVGSAIGFVYSLLLGNFSIGNLLNFLVQFTVSIVPFIYYLLQIKDDYKFKN